jgi:hypothetical protein
VRKIPVDGMAERLERNTVKREAYQLKGDAKEGL